MTAADDRFYDLSFSSFSGKIRCLTLEVNCATADNSHY